MHVQLNNGRSIRLLNFIDDHNWEALGVEVDFSLPTQRVIRSLNKNIQWLGMPNAIRCDKRPESITKLTQE